MQYLTWLRAIAGLLIINSHLEDQHLTHFAAIDGLIGNSLFFFLAGLGLVESERRSRRGFADWYGRRLLRILPSVVLAVLILDYFPHRGWRDWSGVDYLQKFLAPSSYTFVEQILVIYIPFFVVQRLGGRRANAWVLGLSLIAMLGVPAIGNRAMMFHPFHWLYYFQMMLFGAWMAWREEPARAVTPGMVGLFVLTALGYGSAKLATSRPPFAEWYPVLHLLVFPLIFLMIRLIRAEGVARFVDGRIWLRDALNLISGLTLELYLLHYVVRDSAIVAWLPFPINIVVILVGSILLSIPLAGAADGIRQVISRWTNSGRPSTAGRPGRSLESGTA